MNVRIAVVFIVAYVALQGADIAARDSRFQRWLIEDVNVQTSVAIINRLTPEVSATAHGASISAPGVTLNIRTGCEGTEILLPLFAALLAYPFRMRTRLFGFLVGTLWVFALNQGRVLALFYAFRDNPVLFGQLHGLVAPLVLILGVLAFFFGILQWDRQHEPSSALSHSVP